MSEFAPGSAEDALLGAVIHDPGHMAVLGHLDAKHFYRDDNARLWVALRTTKAPIDLVTAADSAARVGVPVDRVTHLYTRSSLTTSGIVKEYARIVIEAWQRREVARVLEERTPLLATTHVGGWVWDLGRRLEAVADSGGSVAQLYDGVADDWLEALDRRVDGEDDADVIGSWGLRTLDETLGQINGGKMIVIAARPAMGKSALGQQIAEHLARDGEAVVFGQTEMSARQMMTRSVSRWAGVNSRHLLRGTVDPEEYQRAVDTLKEVRSWPISVLYTSGLSLPECHAEAKRMGARVIVFDYLQRAKAEGKTEYEVVTAASKQCKDITADGTTVIALVQLSRQIENRVIAERIPQMADIRSSGQIEQDADIILGLVRMAVYDPDAPPDIMQCAVLKDRDGGNAGRVLMLGWEGAYTRVHDMGGNDGIGLD